MFKAIATYLLGRKIVGFIVCAAMMIGLLAVCLIAYALCPEARADEMNPYAGNTYTQYDDKFYTQKLTVNEDGTVVLVGEDNKRVGEYFNYTISEDGELQVLDANDSVIFSATMKDNGTVVDNSGNLWIDEGPAWVD